MKFKPNLPSKEYEGLVTVFAVMIAVEYATGFYDLWDIFIGGLSIYIGRGYWQSAIEKKDQFYSVLVVSLISLGIVCIILGAIFVAGSYLFELKQPIGMDSFNIENIRFVVFAIFTWLLYKKVVSKYKA